MSGETDLIARREAVAKIIAGFGPCRPNETWGPATQAHWRDSLAKADAILTTLEASDADTVRLLALGEYRNAVDRSLGNARATAAADFKSDQHKGQRGEDWDNGFIAAWRIVEAEGEKAKAMLTASHPKPEPVETQPEASRSPAPSDRALVLEEAARVADNVARESSELVRGIGDPCDSEEFAGARDAAERIAAAIRSLSSPPDEGVA